MSLVWWQVDMCSMEEVEEIGNRANSIPISCHLKLNMDGLLERIWEMMALVRQQQPVDSAHQTTLVGLHALAWLNPCVNT